MLAEADVWEKGGREGEKERIEVVATGSGERTGRLLEFCYNPLLLI